eukprot:3098598-Rhodomonas_salina.2
MDSGGLAASRAAKKDQLLVPMQAYLDLKSLYDAAVQSKHGKNGWAFRRLEQNSCENFICRGEVDAALDAKRAAMQQRLELEGAGGAEVVDDSDQDYGVEVEREG